MERKNYSDGVEWEEIVGYSRAVRIGNIIEVSGTTAVDGKEITGLGSSYLQAKFIMEKISRALNELGAKMEDVIRTRIYVINIEDWQEIGKAHNKFFKDIKPATTMVEVKSLIHPDLLVEIEATAVIK